MRGAALEPIVGAYGQRLHVLVAVLNSKGGVGKSTIAVHAAIWLKERGLKLAVVDADAQASTSEWLAAAAPDIRIERCDTAPQLTDRLPRFCAVHDVVVADGPAGLSTETVILASAADLVLLPIGPSMMDLRASYRTARLLYHVRLRVHRDGRPQVFVVLNRVQRRTRLAQVALEAAGKYGFPVARVPLNLRQAYAEACGRGTVVWRMGALGHGAALEIGRLFDTVFEGLVGKREASAPVVADATQPAAILAPAPAPVYGTLPAAAVLTPNSPASPLIPVGPQPAEVPRSEPCPPSTKLA